MPPFILSWLSEVFSYKFIGCLKGGMAQNSQVWRKGPQTEASLM